ncbi:MAG: hypothetical protein NUW01_00060 [Gemmatimonadaceae bacterium]|nr:hypothetical protein [Gemmatimonadaceae bacterium]
MTTETTTSIYAHTKSGEQFVVVNINGERALLGPVPVIDDKACDPLTCEPLTAEMGRDWLDNLDSEGRWEAFEDGKAFTESDDWAFITLLT